MAIYFLTKGGSVERCEHRCLFCDCAFGERKALSLHYFEVHSPAFSVEELVMAAAKRAHEVAAGSRYLP
jgi:wyosine [tRNA(Phe)-imidazoG37] synthetase (radical SAM superfamily)